MDDENIDQDYIDAMRAAIVSCQNHGDDPGCLVISTNPTTYKTAVDTIGDTPWPGPGHTWAIPNNFQPFVIAADGLGYFARFLLAYWFAGTVTDKGDFVESLIDNLVSGGALRIYGPDGLVESPEDLEKR